MYWSMHCGGPHGGKSGLQCVIAPRRNLLTFAAMNLGWESRAHSARHTAYSTRIASVPGIEVHELGSTDSSLPKRAQGSDSESVPLWSTVADSLIRFIQAENWEHAHTL